MAMVRVYVVVVAAADAFAFDVAGFDQVGDDALLAPAHRQGRPS
jgi:hypothetical protein